MVMLKSLDRGVVRFQPNFSFLLLTIVFRLQDLKKKKKSCSFVKIILMNKTCKNQKHLLATEIIFQTNPKANGTKSDWLFAEGTRVMLTFGSAYKTTSSLYHTLHSWRAEKHLRKHFEPKKRRLHWVPLL